MRLVNLLQHIRVNATLIAALVLPPGQRRNDRPPTACRCGHLPDAHEHYRRGTDCSRCTTCPAYRPARRTTHKAIR